MNLREMAKKVTTLSELMSDREKIETSEVVKKYPEGVHVEAIDVVETSEARYSVAVFNECPERFYNGGLVLTKIADAWLSEYTIEEVNAELKKNPVKMRFSESKTKGNNNITVIDVL